MRGSYEINGFGSLSVALLAGVVILFFHNLPQTALTGSSVPATPITPDGDASPDPYSQKPPEKTEAVTEAVGIPEVDEPTTDVSKVEPATPTYQTSFDCNLAQTFSEKRICSDSDLASADIAMAEVYQRAVANAADPEVIQTDQREWLRQRSECANSNCIITLYYERISELRKLLAGLN